MYLRTPLVKSKYGNTDRTNERTCIPNVEYLRFLLYFKIDLKTNNCYAKYLYLHHTNIN